MCENFLPPLRPWVPGLEWECWDFLGTVSWEDISSGSWGLEGGGDGKGLGTMRKQIYAPENGGPDRPTPSLCKRGQGPRRDRPALVIEALPQTGA